jgi:hypothetical protein
MLTKESIDHWTRIFYTIDDKTPPYFNIYEETRYTPIESPHNDISLVIEDIHSPFEKDEILEEVSQVQAENLIIVGDWFDFFSRSHYVKRARPSIDFKREFALAFRTLVNLCKKFPQVYLMIANHDSRFAKSLYDTVSKDDIDFVQVTLLEDLLSVIPNLSVVSQKNGRNINYVWQYRDVVFTHIEKSSVQDSKILEDIERHLHQWRDVYKLNDYRAIIQAHNHRYCHNIIAGKHCYLAPCMIDIDKPAFDYVFNGKAFGKPPVLGYMILKWTEGKFDHSQTKTVIR